MPLVQAIADIKPERIRNRTPKGDGSDSGGRHIEFFKAVTPDDPDAFLVEYSPGGSSRSHYHAVDQFQILVSGEGTFGRHKVTPYSVHFSRAYTAYGPLASPGGWGFLTLRARGKAGSQRDFEKLKQIPGRQPWQVTGKASFPPQGVQASLQAIPGITDDNGLLACAVTVPPGGQLLAPAPAGSLQYVVALKGSLVHEGREHEALTVVCLKPQEEALLLRAGVQGLEALVLNFPRVAATQA